MSDVSIKFLDDVPSTGDELGPHRRIADGLFELLKQKGKKSIALLGSWGSGKSTVINLLEGNIAEENQKAETQVFVFKFDAWAHQGDPLRRAFLDELIEALRGNDWINRDQWEKERKALTEKRDTTFKNTTPMLTPSGRMMVVLIFLATLGLKVFELGLRTDAGKLVIPNLCPYLPTWLFGLVAFFSPIIYAWVWRRKLLKENKPADAESLFNLFFNRTITSDIETKTYSVEHSSIEFQDRFSRLMTVALFSNGNEGKRKIVVVIDNLDRLGQEEALSIWATMRTFFMTKEDANKHWLDYFWLIVPLEPEAPKKLWIAEKHDPNSSEGSKKVDLASSFVEKTFQISFRVPVPVTSEWEEYFKECFRRVFLNFPDNNLADAVLRVFRQIYLRRQNAITPRAIKSYLNKLGASYLQWRDTIGLPSQAAYIALEGQFQTPMELLSDATVDNSLVALTGDPKLRESLCALHFNVLPSKAIQILIGDPIMLALQEGDIAGLKKLQDLDGFYHVCEGKILGNISFWQGNESGAIAKVALAISELDLNGRNWASIWNVISRCMGALKRWQYFDESIAKGINVAIERMPPENRTVILPSMLSALAQSAFLKEPAVTDTGYVENWVRGTSNVFEMLASGSEELLKDNFTLEISASNYLSIVAAISELEIAEDQARFYIFKGNSEELLGLLAQKIAENADLGVEEQVAVILKIPFEKDWGTFTQALGASLDQSQNYLSSQIREYVQSLLNIRFSSISQAEKDGAVEVSKKVVQGAYLMHHLYTAVTANENETTALCFLFGLTHYDQLGQTNRWNSNAGYQTARQIGQLQKPIDGLEEEAIRFLKSYSKYQIFNRAVQKDAAFKPLLVQVFAKIHASEKYSSFINEKSFLADFNILVQVNGVESYKTWIEQMLEKNALITEVMKGGYQEDKVPVYRCLVGYPSALKNQDFVEFILERLKQLDSSQWTQSLTSDDENIHYLKMLRASSKPTNLNKEYSEAVFEICKKFDRTAIYQKIVGNLAFYMECMRSEPRKTLLRNLRDEMMGLDASKMGLAVGEFGDILAQADIWAEAEKADEVFRRMFIPLVKAHSAGGLKWVEGVLGKSEGFSASVKSESVDQLKEEINALLKGELAEDTVAALKRIKKIIKKGAKDQD